MKQMIKETAPEVKRENSAKTFIKDFPEDPLLDFLLPLSEEDCWEFIREETDITPYPGTTFTHLSEVARGLRIPDCDAKRLRNKLYSLSTNPKYDELFPIYSPLEIYHLAKESGVDFYDATAKTGAHYICLKQDSDMSVKLLPVGRFNQDRTDEFDGYGRAFKTVTGRGILALCAAIHRSSVLRSERAEILNNVVDFMMKYPPESNCSKEKETVPMENETVPAAPAPESPKMDYAETLRKLFDSVLTLVEKQAEERGAEKIVQKLKDAGKL